MVGCEGFAVVVGMRSEERGGSVLWGVRDREFECELLLGEKGGSWFSRGRMCF